MLIVIALGMGIFVAARAGLGEGVAAYKAGHYKQALHELEPLAKNGHPQAQFHIFLMYSGGLGVAKDDKKALLWLGKAVEQGSADAQAVLGQAYEFGAFGLEKNIKKAAELIQKGAENGSSYGQVALGSHYEKGDILPKDFKHAMKWYRKAAEQGYPFGQTSLGKMYENGFGVPQNYRQAVDLYRKAAVQGHYWGLFSLGRMYEEGHGVPKDKVLAYMAHSLAVATNDSHDTYFREQLLKQMSPQQIEEGQSLSAGWSVGMPFPRTSKTGQ